MTKWTKNPPIPPTKKPSVHYRYYDPELDEVWCVEIWPNRYLKHFEGWWWPEPIPIEGLDELKEQLRKPKKRGRKKK